MSKVKSYKFSDLYEMSSGISTKPEQAGHGAPFLSFKTVFNNHFLPSELVDLMNTSENEQKIYSIQEGDIFLTRTSETLDELGMSSVAAQDYPRATFSGFLKRLRPRQTDITYHKFMAFYLRSELFRKTMCNNAIMTLRASLNEQIFSYLELILPSFEEQKKIGDFLFDIYKKMQINDQVNNELEMMAKTLYDYWFVQFDFPNAKGKPYKSSGGKMIYKEALNREIPEGWEVKRIDDLVSSINTGLNPRKHFKLGEGSNYYITIKNIEYGRLVFDSSCDLINDESLKRIQQRSRLGKGDILFTSIEPVGKTYLIQEDPKNWNINESVFSFKPDTKVVSSEFLFMLLSSDEVRLKCKNASTGSIHKGIRITPLKEFTVVLPEANVLKDFTKKVSPILQKINNSQKQNQQLAALRDWLLPMLMNGQAKITNNVQVDGRDLSMSLQAKTISGKAKLLEIPPNRKAFAKQVLAGKIITRFKNDPNFTNIKFQKIQFLAEHVIQADLNLNYYYQAAGPYDNVFMHTIYNDLKKNKWYDCKDRKFIALEKQIKIEEYYQNYFGPTTGQLDKLFRLLSGATEAKSEIIATIYAVWNNFIIERKPVAEDELIQSFYDWSERKHQYTKAQVMEGLQWLRENKLEPTGFGKLIKKAKSKK